MLTQNHIMLSTSSENNLTTSQLNKIQKNMGHIYYFEKLEIWNLAIDLSVYIYEITQKLPSEEKFGLTNQMRRASNSISANIAEGVHRKSNKEKNRFLEIAYSSALEVLSHSILANRLKYLPLNDAQAVRSKVEELTNKINSFMQTLK